MKERTFKMMLSVGFLLFALYAVFVKGLTPLTGIFLGICIFGLIGNIVAANRD